MTQYGSDNYQCYLDTMHGTRGIKKGLLWGLEELSDKHGYNQVQAEVQIRRLFRRLGHPAGFRDTLPPPRAPASGTALRSARRPSGKFSGSGVHGPEE